MASDRAKELVRAQKEQRRAEKLRKKNSQDPNDWGTIRQTKEVFKATKKEIPALPWILAGCFAAVMVVMILVGIFLGPLWFWIPLGVLFSFAVTMMVMTRYARKALYLRYQDTPGAAEIAFNDLNKKQYVISPAVSVTKSQDVLHRVIGRCGIVLVGEGEPGRVKKMLETERHRYEQVAYEVPVTTIQTGNKDGQVPLSKLAAEIKRLPKAIDKMQISEVENRLTALDSMKSRFNLPKGPLPTRVSRKMMRGH